jgi:hypothetical protein
LRGAQFRSAVVLGEMAMGVSGTGKEEEDAQEEEEVE